MISLSMAAAGEVFDGYRPRARERFARRLWLKWPAAFDGPSGMNRFEEMLKPYTRGPCGGERGREPIRLLGALNLGDAWSIRPTRELLDKLSAVVGRDGWHLVYGPRNDLRLQFRNGLFKFLENFSPLKRFPRREYHCADHTPNAIRRARPRRTILSSSSRVGRIDQHPQVEPPRVVGSAHDHAHAAGTSV